MRENMKKKVAKEGNKKEFNLMCIWFQFLG